MVSLSIDLRQSKVCAGLPFHAIPTVYFLNFALNWLNSSLLTLSGVGGGMAHFILCGKLITLICRSFSGSHPCGG